MVNSKKKKEIKGSTTFDINGNGILDSGVEATLAMDEIAKKIGEDNEVLKIIKGLKITTRWLRDKLKDDKSDADFYSLSHTYPDKGETDRRLKISPAVLEEIANKTLTNQNMIQPPAIPNKGIDKSKSIKINL